MPVIGLTTNHGKNEYGLPNINLLRAYVSATLGAGGTPVLIPSELPETSRRELFDRLNGILFTGGGDIACERFDGVPHPRVDGVDADRDDIEYALLQLAAREGKPFLGICRGFQVINTVLGGTLFTHIEDQKPNAVKHDYYPNWPRNHIAHLVTVEKGSRLADILGATEIQVNSLHHQGADKISPSLTVVAQAPDGLVEGLELPDHPFGFGVQWHPEWLADRPETRRLFKAFVNACSE